MINYKLCLLLVGALAMHSASKAQTDKIKVPQYNDKYSRYVQQLEDGKPDIDYADFRNSYLQSKQYKFRNEKYDSLKKLLRTAMQSNDVDKVISLSKKMLSEDYTSMYAHKSLQQSYKMQGDSVNYHKYHDIEFGLLNSIVKSGDGKTCETGWHVVKIEEEYFIIGVLDGEFQEQALVSGKNGPCDKMTIKEDDGTLLTYYFEINKIMEMEHKMFAH